MERALIESVANDLAKHQYAVVVPFQYEYYNSKKQLVDMSDDCMVEMHSLYGEMLTNRGGGND